MISLQNSKAMESFFELRMTNHINLMINGIKTNNPAIAYKHYFKGMELLLFESYNHNKNLYKGLGNSLLKTFEDLDLEKTNVSDYNQNLANINKLIKDFPNKESEAYTSYEEHLKDELGITEVVSVSDDLFLRKTFDLTNPTNQFLLMKLGQRSVTKEKEEFITDQPLIDKEKILSLQKILHENGIPITQTGTVTEELLKNTIDLSESEFENITKLIDYRGNEVIDFIYNEKLNDLQQSIDDVDFER